MKTTFLQPLRTMALLALLWALPQSHASAQEFEVDGIWYSVLSEGGVKVIPNPNQSKYTHSEVVLPDTVLYEGAEYAVTEIGYTAFYQCANLVSVKIPKSINNVADGAFYACTSLRYVEITDGSTPLSFTNNYQFWTSPLDSAYIGRDLEYSGGTRNGGNSPFVGKTSSQYTPIKKVVFGDSVTVVGKSLFKRSASLESIILGENVTEIGSGAFSNCTGLKMVVCNAVTPPTCNSTDFKNTSATLYVPEGTLEAYLAAIGWRDFTRIIDATYVPDFMADGIKYTLLGKGKIGVVAINNMTKYEGDIVLPETVMYKGITYTLTTICSGAFNRCNNLTSVSIPATVTAIEEEAFYGCSPRIECKATTPPICVSRSFYNVSGKVYIPEGTLELYQAATGWKDITYLIDAAYVPDFTVDGVTYTQLGKESVGVIFIEPVSIDGNGRWISELVLPATIEHEGITYRLTEICSTGLSGSSWLRSIVIPDGVAAIRSYAFRNCRSLRKVTIPKDITNIDYGTFENCPIDTMIVKSMTPPTLEFGANYTALGNNYNLLIVPTGSWETYMNTSPWNRFHEIREEGGRSNIFEVDGIRYKLLSIDGNEVEVTAGGDYRGDMVIPGTVVYDGKEYVVTAIGKGAFERCADLTSIVISEGVSMLSSDAFSECINLKSVTIPSTLEETAFYDAFDFCKGLENIVVADNHPTLESRGNAIIRKESLELIFGCKSTVIPDDVTGIAPYAFYSTDIEEVKIPNSVTRIGEYAFRHCDSLVSLHVGSGVVEFAYRTNGYGTEGLGNQVRNALSSFSYCNNLRTIVVAEGNPLIDSRNGCNAIVETATNTILLGCNETTIPEGVSAIEFGAFTTCEKLEALHIPSSLDSIPLRTFSYCPNLTTITVDEGNTQFDSRSNCNAIIETATGTLLRGCVNTVIPEDVEHIAAEAFCNCKGLEEIVIPDAVQTVGYRAFSGCTSLTSITFGTGVRELGVEVFPWQNPSLNSPYLETIVFRGATPPTFTSPNPEYELSQYHMCTQLLVPEGSLAAYQSADVWKNFIFITEGEEMVEFESGSILYRVVVGDDYAMVRPRPGKDSASEGYDFVSAGMISVYPDSVVIPETVWYDNKEYVVNAIGELAFCGCDLNFLSIPATVERVGYNGLAAAFTGTVICYAAIPPQCFNHTSFGVSYDAVLRVPKASMELYEQAYWWKYFWIYNTKIEAIEDAAGIESVEVGIPEPQPDAVYDLSGRRIADVENLKSGIYIVNGKKVVIK